MPTVHPTRRRRTPWPRPSASWQRRSVERSSLTAEYWRDFGPFNGHVWLNCAHQGALPRVAAEEAREAIGWKVAPYELTPERFSGVPARLRTALSRLLGAPADQII